LDVHLRGKGVEMRIFDNGRGFDTNALPTNHFGVKIMYERAEEIEAQLQVNSQPGSGTEILFGWQT
jgi:nitrate/nitrite-specific signal transduction histidine kinase